MEQKAARILQASLYTAIATCDAADQPWNSPVFCVYDDALNIYWASAKDSQHSRNIRQNPKVFLALYDSTAAWGMGEGVFIQAEAHEIDDLDEITKACALRKSRAANAEAAPDHFTSDRPRRIYRATPQRIWTNQDGSVNGFFIDQRVELNLATLRPLLAGERT